MIKSVWFLYALCSVFMLPGGEEQEQNSWPAFLGQGASEVDPASVPVEWSFDRNVAWKIQLPGKGQSSPVIQGNRVYVTSIDGSMKDRCHVTCIDLTTGDLLWDFVQESSQPVRSNYFQSRSAPTPVVDAQGVYAFFETGNLVAIGHDGKEMWSRSLTEEFGAFESTIGLAASPIVWKDSLILLVDHEGPSYLLSVDRKTGTTLWKTDRDSRTSYATPSVVSVEGEDHIVCSSSGSVEGYQPETGETLWTLDDVVGGNRATTPLSVGPGRFVISASPGMHNENEGEARKSNGVVSVVREGDGFKASVVWRTEEAMPAFNTPTFHQGLAYWVNRAGVVFCYNAETGEKHYAKRIQQGCWASPVAVGDRVYVFGKDGLTSVLAAGPEFKLLAENQLWNPDDVPAESVARNRAAGRPEGEQRHEHGGAQGEAGSEQKSGEPQAQSTERKQAGEAQAAAKPEANPESQASTESQAAGRPAGGRPEGGRPAGGRPQGGRPGAGGPGGAGGAGGGNYDEQTMAQGENRFADPVQYGVAFVNGSIVIRTGEMVYCVRNSAVSAGGGE